MRRVAAMIAALAIAGVAFVALWNRSGRDETSAAPAPCAGAQESAPVAPESALPPVRAEEPVRESSGDEQEHEAPVETPATDHVDGATEGVLVEGTVVVVDEAGAEHADLSGSFCSMYWSGHSGQGRDTVRVDSGRFRLRVPKETDLGVDDLEFDGRAATAEPDRYEISAGRPLVVRARTGRDVLLHVVDASTQEELRDVTVLWNEDWLTDDTTHPGQLGKDHTLVEHAASPIPTQPRELDGRVRWKPTLYATAPGRAWGSVVVDYHMGGEATIAIPRGGDLEVTIAGEIPPLPTLRAGERDRDDTRLVIRLRESPVARLTEVDIETAVAEEMKANANTSDEDWDEGHRPTEAEVRESIASELRRTDEHPESGKMIAEAAPDADGVTRFAGLAPGPVIVTLERGHHWRDPLLLAHSVAAIVEGGTTRIALNVVARDDVGKRVPFSGTVHFSDAWNSGHLDLQFEPLKVDGGSTVDEFRLGLHDLTRVAGTPGLYRFDAGRVLPGRYLVKSYSLEFQQTIETGSAGTDHAEIVIGDPADVVVHIVDADSGKPFESPPKLLWNCKRPEGSTGGGLDDCEWDESNQVARLRAPAGEIELSVVFKRAGEFDIVGSNLIQANPGSNDVTLQLRAVIDIALRVTVDGVEANWPSTPEAWMTTLTAVDDPSVTADPRCMSENELRFSVAKPGSYTVQVPKMRGFEPVAPFAVEAHKGERIVATVALRRSK